MAPEGLELLRVHLDERIRTCLAAYRHGRIYNNDRSNWIFFANIACTVAATISGLFGYSKTAGIFGAVLTAILAIQKHFSFDKEATWYGVASVRCLIMLAETSSPTATMELLTAVNNELNTLIAEEEEKTKQFSRGGEGG